MTFNYTLQDIFTEGFISLLKKEIVAEVLAEINKTEPTTESNTDILEFLSEEEKVETVPLLPISLEREVVVADSRNLKVQISEKFYDNVLHDQSTVDLANLTSKILTASRRADVTKQLLTNTLNYLDETGHTAGFGPVQISLVQAPEVAEDGLTKEERDEEALKAFSERFGAKPKTIDLFASGDSGRSHTLEQISQVLNTPEVRTLEAKWADTLKTLSDVDFSKLPPKRNVMPVFLPPPAGCEDYIFPPRDPGRGTLVTELPKGADLPIYTGPGVSPMEAPKPEVFELARASKATEQDPHKIYATAVGTLPPEKAQEYLKRLSQKWAEQHLGVKLPDTIEVSQQNLTKRNLTKEQVSFRLLEMINELTDLGIDYVEDTSTFIELGLDSLDCVEVAMMVEEEFLIEIDDNKAENAKTFGQFTTLVWELL